MKNILNNKNLLFTISIIVGALCLMFDAFYNGFPITYSDTGNYIDSGFQLETPFDRPITYGIFIRLTSLNGVSLWLTIFFQSLILSWLIFSLIKLIRNDKPFLIYGFVIVIFLSLFTGVSWTVSQLMPDIFTPIGILCICVILFGKYNKPTTIFLFFIFWLSAAMHMSHLIFYTITLLIILMLKKYIAPKQLYPSATKHILILLLLTLSAIATMGSAFAKSRHVFFMAAMVEHGITKQYLEDNCNTHNYKLCAYKDSLPPKAWQFIWLPNSPFYKVGGWKGTKIEFNQIIFATLTQPKYIKLHIQASIKATCQQLLLNNIGDGNGAFREESPPYKGINKWLPQETQSLLNSKQSNSAIDFINWWNAIFNLIILISLIIILYGLIIKRNSISSVVKTFALIFLLSIVVNAWDCGTFANSIDRLGCKMIWLLPLLASMILLSIINDKFQFTKNLDKRSARRIDKQELR